MRTTALAALAVLLPSLALADIYRCETTNFGVGGWVPPEMIFSFDADKQSATVFDGFIKSVQDEPLPAKFKQFSNTRYQFNWRVKGLKASNGGRGSNTFRVTLFTDRQEFTLSGRRVGYDNVISGNGTCKRVK